MSMSCLPSCYDTFNKLLEDISNINSDRGFKNIQADILKIFDFDCNKLQGPYDSLNDTSKFDIKDKCFLVSKKREDLYTHRYDPVWFEELIKDSENKKELNEIFDITPKDKCCNCISFVLYLKDDSQEYLEKCLKGMLQSVLNIEEKLPDFVIRFYLDSSIFYLLKSMTEKFNSKLFGFILTLQNIINSPNSEIFIYFCEKIVSGEKKIRKNKNISIYTII
jgi:hypothetical protein